MSKLEFMN